MVSTQKRDAETALGNSDDPSIVAEVIPLGAGQEVGRSCILFRYMGKSVLLDCGVHPGKAGLAALPYLDEVDLRSVDLLLVTHFHLDHCAAVPYLTARTAFKGRIFMTHPTKAIYGTLLRDFVKLNKGGGAGGEEGLYSERDLDDSMEKIEVIDFHQTIDVAGIKVTAYRAGHVLGAAMFMVEVAGLRLLYTGDYSRLADRHLSAADLPPVKPHIVVVEATYGVSRHEPREARERRFVERVRQVVQRGGRLLLPVVALGRAQELLLILDEFWQANPDLQHVPIYQASGLARRALTVYQTYIEMMNDDIKRAFQVSNPFVLKHVTHLKSASQLDGVGPAVVMATPSMLQSGMSRDLFEAWCEDPKNGVIIADFAVQGTLAREILGAPSFILTRNGARIPLRCSVDAISFSAHADFDQTSGFLDALQPPHVVLVHGEAGEMGRLRKALEQRAAVLGITRHLYMPKVTQAVQVHYRAQRTAKVVGQLADKPPAEGAALGGLLVRQGHADSLMAPGDLPLFTKLQPARVRQRQAVSALRPFPELRLALEVVFEGVSGAGDLGGVAAADPRAPRQPAGQAALRVADAVTVTYVAGEAAAPYCLLEWEGGPARDLVADAVVAVLLQAAGEPEAVGTAEAARRRALAEGRAEDVEAAEMAILAALLHCQFGSTHVDAQQGLVVVQVDERQAVVDFKSGKVECPDELLQGRVERAVKRIMDALQPASLLPDVAPPA